MNKLVIAGAAVLVLAGAFVFFKKFDIVPSVAVDNQKFSQGEIIAKEVVVMKSSWLVIQTNEGGVPGPVIGYVKISEGVNKNVSVKIDQSKATPSLYAMIHEDDGKADSFDFPENDMPLMYKDEMVAKIFTLN